MDNFTEAKKKRNLSELSEASSPSPVLQPTKSSKMSLDTGATSLTMRDPETCNMVLGFLSTSQKIPQDLLFSKTNPGGEVKIDVAQRIGQLGLKPRPIVIAFVTQYARSIVLTQGKLLMEMRNEARQSNSKQNIKLMKDKLLIDSKVKSDVFESKPLEYITGSCSTIRNENIQHSTSISVKNSVFQGHFYPAYTEEEAKSVLRALHQDPMVTECHHLICAYKYMDIDGHISSGYSDDGEWKASQILVNLLDQEDIGQGIVIVMRKYGGIKLGGQRFDLIKQVAAEALQKN